jgi:transcription elongation factor GreA
MPESISNRFKMSQERLDALKEELVYLETVREKEVAELIKEARSFGDLSENSEYDEAKTEQGKLYSKIAELKVLIENAEIVDNMEADAPKDTVTLGSRVRVRDLEDGFEDEYEIVGSQEANPREGRISDDSPLFQALKGRRKGETVSVTAPAGVFKYEIVSVNND